MAPPRLTPTHSSGLGAWRAGWGWVGFSQNLGVGGDRQQVW
ncbi:hypothetical protein [Microcoleus sp. MOSTC5]